MHILEDVDAPLQINIQKDINIIQWISQAMGHDNGLDCGEQSTCQNCVHHPHPRCYAQPKYFRYRVEEYGPILGDTIEEREENMKAEIFWRGPITCQIAVTQELVNFTGTA